jgi:hypothetical protein
MAIKFNFLFAIFFTIIGILQIFWAIPTIKRWSKFWDYVGIVGTSILLILWANTRIPEFTGSGFPFNDFDFATIWFEGEIFRNRTNRYEIGEKCKPVSVLKGTALSCFPHLGQI